MKVGKGKTVERGLTHLSHKHQLLAAVTATTAAKKKAAKWKKKVGASSDKQNVLLEELKVQYMKVGTKMDAYLSDNTDDEDYVAKVRKTVDV